MADKIVTKKKVLFLVPKSKPLIVKKEIEKSKKKSKYFRQKDYILAKKAIQEIEKKIWSKALAISKKAKDKSISPAVTKKTRGITINIITGSITKTD